MAPVRRTRRGAGRRRGSEGEGARLQTGTLSEADQTLAALEEALAAELRLALAIDLLAEWERVVLRQDDPTALAAAARCKAACHMDMVDVQIARGAAAAAWARQAGCPECVTLVQVLARLDYDSAARLSQYHLGTLAHLEHARALSPGSRALARITARRHANWSEFLLSHY